MRRRPSGVEIFKAHSYPRSTLRAISARNSINVSAERSATGVAVVQVCGEVDMHTAPILRAELEDQLDPPPTVLVLDLTDVTFLAASGIRVLLEARERAAMTGAPLRLVYATRGVHRVLDVLNLNHLFPPYATLADALASGDANLRGSVRRQRAYRISAQVARDDDPLVNQAQKQQR